MSNRMGHGDAMLAAISGNLKKAEAERQRQAIGRQNAGEVPALSRGFVRAISVDKSYQLFGHEPLLESLPAPNEYKEATPVAAYIFNPAAVIGIKPEDTYKESEKIQQLGSKVFNDLFTLGNVIFTNEADVHKGTQPPRYNSYIAVADFITNGSDSEPRMTKDTKSLGRLLSYLMTREHDGKALVSPKEVLDTTGYGFLMEMTKPKNINDLRDKLNLDFDAAMKKAYERDPETVSRITTYRMALKQITPQEIDEKYGADVLMAATSQENLDWYKGLTHSPRTTLEDIFPDAAQYLKSRESASTPDATGIQGPGTEIISPKRERELS